jgi:hypothetical protein
VSLVLPGAAGEGLRVGTTVANPPVSIQIGP